MVHTPKCGSSFSRRERDFKLNLSPQKSEGKLVVPTFPEIGLVAKGGREREKSLEIVEQLDCSLFLYYSFLFSKDPII